MRTGQTQKRWTRVASQSVRSIDSRPWHTDNRAAPTRPGNHHAKKKPVHTCCNAHWRDLCSSSSSPKPRLPSIPPGQFRRCQYRLLFGVFALRSFAAMLELTLYLSLVVRRWCRAFLFDSLSMEQDFAENVCQLVDILRILRESRVWHSHPVSYQSSHWSPFRMGLSTVPHLHIRCRDELLAKLVQQLHLDLFQPCHSRILRH